jgi:hypothetical protein
VRLRALEVPIELIFHGSGADDLLAAVETAWDWCRDPDPTGTPHRVSVLLEPDRDLLARTAASHTLFGSDLATVMDRLSPVVTRVALSARAGTMAMFHGCALADTDSGDTAVLFGPSGMGKTTLARTLGVDLAYLTDEAAGVDSAGQVVQYPKPLSILREPDSPLKEQVSPGELGLRRRTEGPFPLRALVQLRRDPDHPGDPSVEPLHTVDALAEMVVQTSFSRRMEHPLQQLAALARLVGGVRRVTYAEAGQLRPVVASLLEGHR